MSVSFDTESFFRHHIEAMSSNLSEIATGIAKLHIPTPDTHFLINIANEVTSVFKTEPTLLELEGPVVVVGDLHGHLLDLYRILKTFDLPPTTTYLFLGDLVDRGEFSIEIISFVFVLKILFPKNIFIIRGNHEFRTTTINGGLMVEINRLYPRSSIFETLIDTFQYIPLAAKIGEKILCLHGGLSPGFTATSQISQLERPISNYENPVVCGLLWSDPSEKTDFFMPSPRGTGFLFGQKALFKFLKYNHLSMIIRGHECTKEGFSAKFDNRILTVFSASNYCGVTGNQASVIVIEKDLTTIARFFSPFQYLKRKDVLYDLPKVYSLRKTVHMVTPQSQILNTPILRGAVTMTANQTRPFNMRHSNPQATITSNQNLFISHPSPQGSNLNAKMASLTKSSPSVMNSSEKSQQKGEQTSNSNISQILCHVTRRRQLPSSNSSMIPQVVIKPGHYHKQSVPQLSNSSQSRISPENKNFNVNRADNQNNLTNSISVNHPTDTSEKFQIKEKNNCDETVNKSIIMNSSLSSTDAAANCGNKNKKSDKISSEVSNSE
ncbi:hypothetical protein M9Y10_022600 [Tritrichomonas musculus]|uniref:Serine/threonine-protein phosphatase n=1 Tax=Tritrichomonas musculus TaxID=1915356 RepID=A0ABR2KUP0_9EUKA